MTFRVHRNLTLAKTLGSTWTGLLESSLGALPRILPHTESSKWRIDGSNSKNRATFTNADRRTLSLDVGVVVGERKWRVRGLLKRLSVPAGVGAISRTLDERERDIADCAVQEIAEMFKNIQPEGIAAASALRSGFDERVVARHLRKHHKLDIDLSGWFAALRQLAEQSYENKALTFGCIIRTTDLTEALDGQQFPADFLQRKRYRALSDGYRTVYRVSSKGTITGFDELPPGLANGHKFHPKWCDEVASQSRAERLGLCLTRQGDILVLDSGHLTFTYRFGRWQYWNHAHIVDLLKNAARVQKVPLVTVSKVVRSIYRAALDVAFRRSGGLFVILRNQKNLRRLVRSGDAIGDPGRPTLDGAFDDVLGHLSVHTGARSIIAELAALDGAVVVTSTGKILAYGAVLDPKRKGRVRAAEGSRTKAAIGASNYGLVVKVSSDGDITVYSGGKKLIEV